MLVLIDQWQEFRLFHKVHFINDQNGGYGRMFQRFDDEQIVAMDADRCLDQKKKYIHRSQGVRGYIHHELI